MNVLNTVLPCPIGLLVAMPLAFSVQAEEFDADLGVSLLGQQKHVIGEEQKAELRPYVTMQYGLFVAGPEGVGLSTKVAEQHKLSALLLMRESVIDRDDNAILGHFDERKNATELALQWTYFTPYVDVTTAISMDASDTHEGYEAKVMLSKRMTSDFGILIPAAAIHYQSDELVDYYYGVRSTEANARLQAYKGKASTQANVSLTHVYPITDQWHVATRVAYEHLGQGIRDSSIVERSNFWSGAMTVFYAF